MIGYGETATSERPCRRDKSGGKHGSALVHSQRRGKGCLESPLALSQEFLSYIVSNVVDINARKVGRRPFDDYFHIQFPMVRPWILVSVARHSYGR